MSDDWKGKWKVHHTPSFECVGTRPVETTEPLELPARSRLFVTCPKDMTKDQLQALFSNYGEVESVKLLMDKGSKDEGWDG